MNKAKKILVSSIVISLMMIVCSTIVSANTANYDMQLTTKSTTVDLNTQTEITIYLKLTEFSSTDTMLGYEAVLDYDENIFSGVTVTGMNDWIGTSSSNDIYNKETKKLVSTTGNAKTGTNVAKLVFTIRTGIEPQNTMISLDNLLISTGSEDETSSEGVVRTISLNLQKNEPEQKPDQQPEDDNGQENDSNSNNAEDNGQDENQNTNDGQNNNNHNQINNGNSNNSNNQGNNETSDYNDNGQEGTNSDEEKPQTNSISNVVVNTVTNTNRANITVTPTDNTKAQGSIPQTGSNTQILGAIVIIAILGIIMYIRYRSIEIK